MAEDGALDWYLVGSQEELNKRKCRRLYTESGNDLALFCVKEGVFFATSASCPHARGPIDQGDIEELGSSFTVTCPLHYYTYDLKSGSSITGLKLPTYPTKIEEGQVYVKAPELVSVKSIKRSKNQDGSAPTLFKGAFNS
ncbi:hypothetical protein ACOMHN_026301 [Nucella lapillus]